jgi:hypothetical protein
MRAPASFSCRSRSGSQKKNFPESVKFISRSCQDLQAELGRQASRAWNKRLEVELTAHALGQSDADSALWIMQSGGHVLTIFYVDFGMVAARTGAEVDALVDPMAGMFSIRKLGMPQDMLGIEISRDRDAGTITIRQASQAQSLATAFGVEGEKPISRALAVCCTRRSACDLILRQLHFGSRYHLWSHGPLICGAMRFSQHVLIRSAVCLNGWSCVLRVQCLGRAASSRRQRHLPWTPSTRHSALHPERRCRFVAGLAWEMPGRSPDDRSKTDWRTSQTSGSRRNPPMNMDSVSTENQHHARHSFSDIVAIRHHLELNPTEHLLQRIF